VSHNTKTIITHADHNVWLTFAIFSKCAVALPLSIPSLAISNASCISLALPSAKIANPALISTISLWASVAVPAKIALVMAAFSYALPTWFAFWAAFLNPLVSGSITP
jgi:hypothetical protein